ncbi:MAG TPA: hypothetical protein VNJ51_01590 [Candidatus Dormibacteraeota bacterium]|nr:hypothetical protein [Candidatus Dormibacteraeota bacterium]
MTSAVDHLLASALAGGRRSIAVVGAGKDVGKTATTAALASAARRAGHTVAITSVGRDGEVHDVATNLPKPQLVLPAGTVVATAAALLPRSPASEVLELTPYRTALGRVVIVRLHAPTRIEIAGPNTASAMLELIASLRSFADVVLVDGAVDRIAATARGDDAIIVATGAALAPTLRGVVERTRALVDRLSLPGGAPPEAIAVDGALTPERAAELLARSDRARGVVLEDPLALQIPAQTAAALRRAGGLWCLRALHVAAVTVNAHGRERDVDPVALAEAVACATGLPTYDVYRNAAA